MNNKKSRKLLLIAAVMAFFVIAIAACGGNNNGNDDDNVAADNGGATADERANDGAVTNDEETPPEETGPERPHDFDESVVGEITIMVPWAGPNFVRDIGNLEIPDEEIGNVFFAAFHSTARVFNEIYPNVVINLYQTYNQDYWDQQRDNFMAEHGRFPDIFQSHNLIADAHRGLVADLSVFADDPRMQRINPAILDLYTIHGFIPGLPFETQPQGVYVNREMAEQHNIDPPRLDWTIQEFTDFVNNSDGRTFWGQFEAPIDFINHGTTFTHYSVARPGPDGVPFVDLENEEVRNLLSYVPLWTRQSIQNLNQQGQMPAGVMDAHWWWRIFFWTQGTILATHTNHWELGRVASTAYGVQLAATSNDWDVYPFPSTPYRDNTIQLHFTPWAIYNYAEGRHEWTAEERAQLDLAFSFMIFYLTDNRAWEARANQQQVVGVDVAAGYVDIIGTHVPTNFPIVTGADFNLQMQTMFSTDSFSQLADSSRFPGFNKVLDIMQRGDAIGIGGTAFPSVVEEAGGMVNVLHEWNYVTNADLVGAYTHDPQWLDTVLAHLPEWNRNINDRLQRADQALRESLERWYGYSFE